MTRANRSRVPGTTLLKIARLLFSKRLLSEVVQPTISDLQHEVAQAGPGRGGRFRAQWRGYFAFWKLTLVAPFASGASRAGDKRGAAFPNTVTSSQSCRSFLRSSLLPVPSSIRGSLRCAQRQGCSPS